MTGVLESINVAPDSGGPTRPLDRAELIAGKGIVGDRNFRDGGAMPESEVTLIEREQVARFRESTGLDIDAAATRRNLETSGIDLNALVGQRFHVGEAVLEGLELCEPCATLGNLLATAELTPADIVRSFTHRAGLRARIVHGATVYAGDRVTPA
jgi:MOSC domain-containing protein YiiM